MRTGPFGQDTDGAEQPTETAVPRGGLLTRRRALALTAGFALSGCSSQPGSNAFAPTARADQIVVTKSSRSMQLMSGGQTLASYRVFLGFTPHGHKMRSGDGRTPEGRYWIDRRNPRSEFYLSLGISYPNAQDVARAHAMGVDPGGDIFIHGEPDYASRGRIRGDWTAGCIAVTNAQIEEIWSLVPTGTPITILA